MRYCLLILLAGFVSACGMRSIPPEISILHEQKKVSPRKMETIVVDAGHGGKDGGSISKRDGYEEKELTLETAQMICTCLHQLGYKTVLTRSQDIYVPLSSRAEIANSLGAELFVSIHYNYSPNSEANGVEVYYYKEEKNPASNRIMKSKALGNTVLRKVIVHTGAESRGLKQANFAVIRETHMPAILVEAGFLSNPRERERVSDPKYQRSIARGIAQGIDYYLETNRGH